MRVKLFFLVGIMLGLAVMAVSAGSNGYKSIATAKAERAQQMELVMEDM